MENKGFQIENYVVHPSGTVWCIEQNEMIYSSTYEDCVEFVNNITASLGRSGKSWKHAD